MGKWEREDFESLAALCERGLTYDEIAKELGRSRAAVQLMAGRKGISNNLPLGGALSREPRTGSHNRNLDIGTAAEHIVCADLILAGYRAMMAAAGLPYDVLLDVGGRILRVGVKCAGSPSTRPEREGARVCYQFSMVRSGRNITQKSQRYTTADCELFALVALDSRQVIYIAPSEGGIFLTSFHVDPIDAPVLGRSRNGTQRKHWSMFPLDAALAAIGVGQRP